MRLNDKKSSGERVTGQKRPLVCISCNRQCAIVFETEKPLYDQQFRCICPCNSKTFVVKSRFQCHFIQSPDLEIVDWQEEDNNYVITLAIRK